MNQSGLSLLEVIVATAVTVVLIGVITGTMIEATRVQDYLTEQSSATGIVKKALADMAKTLRETDDGEDGSYPIIEATDTAITFFADIDTDSEIEQVRYYLSGTQLLKDTIQPTGSPATYPSGTATTATVANNIVNQTVYSNPVFTYYNSDYPTDTTNNPLTSPVDVSAITLVEIHVDVDAAPQTSATTTAVTTSVQLRNLKTNL